MANAVYINDDDASVELSNYIPTYAHARACAQAALGGIDLGKGSRSPDCVSVFTMADQQPVSIFDGISV